MPEADICPLVVFFISMAAYSLNTENIGLSNGASTRGEQLAAASLPGALRVLGG